MDTCYVLRIRYTHFSKILDLVRFHKEQKKQTSIFLALQHLLAIFLSMFHYVSADISFLFYFFFQ